MVLLLLLIRLHYMVNPCGAIPLASTEGSDKCLTAIALSTSQVNDQRTTLDILWSCLATTFAVTWLSAHPNIPALNEKAWWVTWRRMKLMFWAFVAPEFIVLWAWRQRRGARKIAEEVRKLARARNQKYGHDWTTTHGHFLQMGGFNVQNGNRSRVLYFHQWEQMVGKSIDIPSISKEEIDDKGKSDPLGKGIASLQIMWFIIQVIARQMNHLTVTQLELTSAALACLNTAMYILWWNKPLDVRCPVIIPLYPSARSLRHQEFSFSSEDSGDIMDASQSNEQLKLNQPVVQPLDHYPAHEADRTYCAIKRKIYLIASSIGQFFLEPCLDITRTISDNLQGAFTGGGGVIAGIYTCIYKWPLSPFFRLVVGIVADLNEYDDRTPIFYVWTEAESVSHQDPFHTIRPTTTWLEMFIVSLVGAFFGAIHLLGWNLEFPSAPEKNMWRISACTITAVPCLYTSFRVLITRPWSRLWMALAYLIVPISLCAVIARILLFIDSLLALRDLPPSSLVTLNWLSILPHI